MHGMRRWPPWAADYLARLTSITALTHDAGELRVGDLPPGDVPHFGSGHRQGKHIGFASADQRATSLKTRRSPPALTLTYSLAARNASGLEDFLGNIDDAAPYLRLQALLSSRRWG